MNTQTMQMGAVPNVGGPVGGATMMQTPSSSGLSPGDSTNRKVRLNTYIYDYFLRCGHYDVARAMLKSSKSTDKNVQLVLDVNHPGSGELNGASDGMDTDSKIDKKRNDLPDPGNGISGNANCFLEDWFAQFWDIYDARRDKNRGGVVTQYIHANQAAARFRHANQQHVIQQGTNQVMGSYGRPQGQMIPIEIAKQAMLNRNNQINSNMLRMRGPPGHMAPNGNGMDMSDQRSQSPSVGTDAPSPSKRPRMDGAFNAQQISGGRPGMPGQAGGMAVAPNQMMLQSGMDVNFAAAMHNGQAKLEMGQGSPPNADGAGGNHALQDYQMQLMLLEQQNKKRLLMARQEQEAMPLQGSSGMGGAGGAFSTGMSPQGSRNGPSPNPTEMQKPMGTPKIPTGVLPGSPANGDAAGNLGQMYGMQPGMLRGPGGHPNFQMGNMPGNMNQQMMEAQARRMPNGQQMFAGPPMMPQSGQQIPGGPQQPGQPAQMGTPRQANNMPPPPAPAGDQSNRPNPASPAQSAQPATGSTAKGNASKAAKKKDPPKKNVGKGKNAAAAATPASEAEPGTPAPSTPITPRHPNSFANQQKNGAQPAAGAQAAATSNAPAAPTAPVVDSSVAPLGDFNVDGLGFDSTDFNAGDMLETFDFESFLHTDGNDNFGFPEMMAFDSGAGVEAVGDV